MSLATISSTDGHGNAINPGNAIFPILKQNGKIFKLVGTGFFISTCGVFVTAKHVLNDVFDIQRNQTCSIGAFQFFGEKNYIPRPILRCSSNTIADIAVGILAPAQHNVTKDQLLNHIVTMTTEAPRVGEKIMTYAYPETKSLVEGNLQSITFKPNFYEGLFEEHAMKGPLMPYECYRGTVKVLSGASGGPVFDEKGRVFGVNCTGFDGTDISYYARTNEIIPLTVENVNLDGVHRESIGIKELVKKGHIIFKPALKF